MADDPPQRIPPGQEVRAQLPVKHYGPVPTVADPDSWTMAFGGSTATGAAHQLTMAQLNRMPHTQLVCDLHCAGKWSVLDNVWDGVLTRDVLARFPPRGGITDVIVYGQYGYSATLTVADLVNDTTMLATSLNGVPLAPEHGFPVRLIVANRYSFKGPKWFRGWEYLTTPRRGFWEERGYHLRADPWLEERYSYQETRPRVRRPTADQKGPGPPTQRPGSAAR